MKEAAGEDPALLLGLKRLSLNEIVTAAVRNLEMAGTGNWETRVWRPSLPVISYCGCDRANHQQ